jgi:diguanylate cyclase (GGDEF)-like protein
MKLPEHPRVGFRAWLLLLAGLAAVPMILFSILMVLLMLEGQRKAETVALMRRARAIAAVLESHLTAQASMLFALATSDAARRDDLPALYAHASRLVDHAAQSASISLVDADGAILFNTLRPFGQRLPPSQDPESARRVVKTGQVLVSGPFEGSITHRRVVVVGIPVAVGDVVQYCLRAVTPVTELYAILDQQRLPDDWTAAILSAGAVVAAYDPAALIGALVASDDGGPGQENGGEEQPGLVGGPASPAFVAARAAVGQWGWSVVVAMPEAAYARPMRLMLVRFGVAGLTCLLAGFAASLWLARRLDRDVCALTEAGASLAAGSRPYDAGVIIREMDEVRACLLAARDREEQALTDAVTGLPARAKFQEQAEKLEAQAQNDPRLGLAVLFVDLDGFKEVNDMYGHERGDWVLGETARVLRENIREADALGRLGGDEFVVCLTAPREQLRGAAEAMAGRVVSGVRDIGYGLGCSIGISLSQSRSPSLRHGLELADAAMYEAKRLGKDRYVLREEAATDGPA